MTGGLYVERVSIIGYTVYKYVNVFMYVYTVIEVCTYVHIRMCMYVCMHMHTLRMSYRCIYSIT